MGNRAARDYKNTARPTKANLSKGRGAMPRVLAFGWASVLMPAWRDKIAGLPAVPFLIARKHPLSRRVFSFG